MNTPLTTAEIVERLTTDSDLLDAWATWELGALPVPGPMNHADIATNLRTAASALLALEGERDEAQRAHEHTKYWYSVRLERLKDLGKEYGIWPVMAAIIANGTADPAEPPTYAQAFNLMLHRAEAAEAELAKAREERDAFFDKLRQLLCINSVLTALKADAPLWLEHAEKLIDDHNAALSEKTV